MSRRAPDAPESDESLAARAVHDRQAFAELYRRTMTQIYRYLLVRTGNVQDAQDLTSQTYLAALEKIGSFRGDGAVAAWLMSIARHKLMDHFRNRQVNLDLEAALESPEGVAQPEEQTRQRLALERAALALDALSPDRAEALSLRIFGGLSVPEIAQIMDRSEPAVRMLVHRGLRDLRERLTHVMETTDGE